jgi:DNA-binding NarL/FixJ family response regulator
LRILIADDQPRVRFALRTLLERRMGSQMVTEAADLREMWVQLETSSPDLLLLDWELSESASGDLVSAIHLVCPHVRVIAMSGHSEIREEVLAAGADAFVCKCEPPEGLYQALVDAQAELRRD